MTPALSDALTILGAAGIVIPTFARFKINPVIGFILVGIVAGPFGLGALTGRYPWLDWFSGNGRSIVCVMVGIRSRAAGINHRP